LAEIKYLFGRLSIFIILYVTDAEVQMMRIVKTVSLNGPCGVIRININAFEAVSVI